MDSEGHRYGTTLVDLECNQVIDLLQALSALGGGGSGPCDPCRLATRRIALYSPVTALCTEPVSAGHRFNQAKHRINLSTS